MEDTTSARAILNRLKQGTGAHSDTALGALLGLAQQSVYNAKAKGKIPDSWIRKAAERFDLSTDWILFGEGAMHRGDKAGAPPPLPQGTSFPPDIVFDVVETLEEFLQAQQRNLPPSIKAEVVRQLCQMIIDQEEGAVRPGQMLRLIQGALSKAG